MRSKLPTDKKNTYGFASKEYIDFIEKQQKEKTETRRYRISTAISIIALVVALIALFN